MHKPKLAVLGSRAILLRRRRDNEKPNVVGYGFCLHTYRRNNRGAVPVIAATCLALAIYFEARGESEHGQRMIARVVVNRMKSPKFPDEICDVIMQPKQFSFVKNGKMPKPKNKAAWQKSVNLANEIMQDTRLLPYSKADHYHATYVKPFWARKLYRVSREGQHIFYSWEHPTAVKISLKPKQRPRKLLDYLR
jgi:spore germination cell wall hydrolase CwlJ-like protein